MEEADTSGNGADTDHGNDRGPEAPSGWVTTQQAARALGISPRTVRWHIDKGNLEAKPEGEGVKRTWLVSIDSLQVFRDSRQAAADSARTDRAYDERAGIAPDTPGNPIRELADRLAEEAAWAAEYRLRLELTEQAQSTLEEELAAERVRREQAERERDELRLILEATSETTGGTETPPEGFTRGDVPQTPAERVERPPERNWWRRFFGFD